MCNNEDIENDPDIPVLSGGTGQNFRKLIMRSFKVILPKTKEVYVFFSDGSNLKVLHKMNSPSSDI